MSGKFPKTSIFFKYLCSLIYEFQYTISFPCKNKLKLKQGKWMKEGQRGRLILLDFVIAILCHATLHMKGNHVSDSIRYELNKRR